MTRPAGIILQTPGGHATATVRQAALLMDVLVLTAKHEHLSDHLEVLRCGWMPVGSVEFVRSAIRKADVFEPANIS